MYRDTQRRQHGDTVYRDKYGRKVDPEEERKKERRRREAVDTLKEEGRGSVQKRQADELSERLKKERDESLAVYADDTRLNDQQRDRMHWDDPMREYLEKERRPRSRKHRVAARPVYRGPLGPPNRFNITPGHLWDGVDRGNGFEARLLARRNEREAARDAAYRLSVEDM